MIKIGVLGAGHLGKIHIKLIQEIDDFELVGVYDPDEKAREKVANDFGVKTFTNMDELITICDAIDVVSPTTTHFACAQKALKQFKHIFIEKPVTNTLEEADSLVQLVREANVKAQVGHVERFNPAFLAVRQMELHPMFIESHRLAQWNPRGTDVSVVLDLMIHDIDIVLSMVKSEVKKVSASGVAVISDTPDIANARIEFNNGCVANLTASRISMKQMRKMRIFQKNAYVSVDFLEKKAEIFNLSEEGDPEPDPTKMKFTFDSGGKTKYLSYETPKIENINSIRLELEEFANAITQNTPTSVTLEEATAALKTAYSIVDKINQICIV